MRNPFNSPEDLNQQSTIGKFSNLNWVRLSQFFHFPPAQKSLTGETTNEGPGSAHREATNGLRFLKSFLGDLIATAP